MKIASLVRKKARKYFDFDPIILPFPLNSPPELPQIIIQNPANKCEFQLSNVRFDISRIFSSDNEEDTFEVIREIQAISKKIYKSLTENFGAKINRLGFISTVSFGIEKAPEFIRTRYLTLEDAQDSEAINLLYLHKIDAAPFKLFKWVRFLSSLNPSQLLLEIDVNTQPEMPIVDSLENVEKFWDISNKLIKDSIALN
jgi:hypothetical protein